MRLTRLYQLGILDTPDSAYFRAIAEQALSLIPGTSMAAVSLVDAERQWFKTTIGLDVRQTPRCVSFCSHAIQQQGTMVIPDAAKDPRFADSPLVTGPPFIRFYAGVTLAGAVGTLCVMGKTPLSPSETELARLARLAAYADIQLLAHGARYNCELL